MTLYILYHKSNTLSKSFAIHHHLM